MPSVIAASSFQPLRELLGRLTTIRPQEVKVTIGMDLGSSAIKVLALGPKKGAGPRSLLGQQLAPIPAGNADPSDAIKSAIIKLHMPVRAVNLSVSGQWVIMRIIEMPSMKPAEIRQALPYEAQRYLPFSIQDVVVDGLVLGQADANKVWVLIVACKKELIERRIDWVRRAGMDVALIDVDALALTNAYLASARKPEGTHALIHIGAQLTNLVILRGDIPYLVRDIPWGGEKLVRVVADQLQLDAGAITNALTENQITDELREALHQWVEPLVTELELSFDYFENRFGQPPEAALVSGGVGQSAAFQGALKRRLAQSVASWAPASGVSSQFAVAYGLALRTL